MKAYHLYIAILKFGLHNLSQVDVASRNVSESHPLFILVTSLSSNSLLFWAYLVKALVPLTSAMLSRCSLDVQINILKASQKHSWKHHSDVNKHRECIVGSSCLHWKLSRCIRDILSHVYIGDVFAIHRRCLPDALAMPKFDWHFIVTSL